MLFFIASNHSHSTSSLVTASRGMGFTLQQTYTLADTHCRTLCTCVYIQFHCDQTRSWRLGIIPTVLHNLDRQFMIESMENKVSGKNDACAVTVHTLMEIYRSFGRNEVAVHSNASQYFCFDDFSQILECVHRRTNAHHYEARWRFVAVWIVCRIDMNRLRTRKLFDTILFQSQRGNCVTLRERLAFFVLELCDV